MVTIIFESHGTTFDNEANLSSGIFDVELSELGERQAKELGKRYENDLTLSAIFCSDLQRSWKTAEIAFAGRDIPIVKDRRLRECDYGDLTRHPSVEVEPSRGQHVNTPFPHGKSYEQCAVRMKSFLDNLAKDYDGKTVMIIGHRVTQYGLEHWINGVPLVKAVTAPWKWSAPARRESRSESGRRLPDAVMAGGQPGWTYHKQSI